MCCVSKKLNRHRWIWSKYHIATIRCSGCLPARDTRTHNILPRIDTHFANVLYSFFASLVPNIRLLLGLYNDPRRNGWTTQCKYEWENEVTFIYLLNRNYKRANQSVQCSAVNKRLPNLLRNPTSTREEKKHIDLYRFAERPLCCGAKKMNVDTYRLTQIGSDGGIDALFIDETNSKHLRNYLFRSNRIMPQHRLLFFIWQVVTHSIDAIWYTMYFV